MYTCVNKDTEIRISTRIYLQNLFAEEEPRAAAACLQSSDRTSMGKSGKKPRESHRQGRGRRASHFDDDLPSSAYDALPPHHNDSTDDDDDTNEATAEDEREENGEAGEQDQWPAGSMPSKFHLYQLSVQVNRLASGITWIRESL